MLFKVQLNSGNKLLTRKLGTQRKNDFTGTRATQKVCVTDSFPLSLTSNAMSFQEIRAVISKVFIYVFVEP